MGPNVKTTVMFILLGQIANGDLKLGVLKHERNAHTDDMNVNAERNKTARRLGTQASPAIVWSGGDWPYTTQVLANDVTAWTDRSYTYHDVPNTLNGIGFFSACVKCVNSGSFTITNTFTGSLFVFIWGTGDGRDGGISSLGWTPFGSMSWLFPGRPLYPLNIYSSTIRSRESLVIPISQSLVGGIGFMEATASHYVQKKTVGKFDALEVKIHAVCKDNDKIRKLWRTLDFNGNNVVSLAEIDKFVVENYEILNHKPALMRAYKRTIYVKSERDEYVHKKDFKCLLANLFYFNKLFWLFDQVDEDRDRRLTFKEFRWCLSTAGVKCSEAKAQQEFKTIDRNGGGIILFDEFCTYFVQKKCPQAMTDFIDNN